MNKIKRKIQKQKRKEAKKQVGEKITFFGKIPDCCEICNASFDKKSKEQVMSWSVIVRDTEELVKLYCPICWTRVNKLVQTAQEISKNE